jgi:hypothetical protein
MVPDIVERFNQNQKLALRALANPLLAMEELGIFLAPLVMKEAERRICFNTSARLRLLELEEELLELLGEVCDPKSSEDVARVLFTKLGLTRPSQLASLDLPLRPAEVLNVLGEMKCPSGNANDWEVRQAAEASSRAAARSPSQASTKEGTKTGRPGVSIRLSGVQTAAAPDPLEELRGSHPVVDLLLAHRAILQHGLRLATRAEYNACCSLSAGLSISSVTVRLPVRQENTNG